MKVVISNPDSPDDWKNHRSLPNNMSWSEFRKNNEIIFYNGIMDSSTYFVMFSDNTYAEVENIRVDNPKFLTGKISREEAISRGWFYEFTEIERQTRTIAADIFRINVNIEKYLRNVQKSNKEININYENKDLINLCSQHGIDIDISSYTDINKLNFYLRDKLGDIIEESVDIDTSSFIKQ